MAFEALNHAGSLPANLLIVLNDNDMSISENVGALSNYLARALSGRMYSHLRESGKKVLRQMPTVWELARRSEEHLKGMVLPGTLFEEMGFNYIGPIDGHDVKALVNTLSNLRKLRGPQFLHVVTRKGKGYAPAEADPIKWHGPGPFDPASGMIFKEASTGPSYSQIFGKWLCDMAERDPSIVGITPAMREGSGLVEYSKRFPERYFDVAIAEQHAVTLAAGMAVEGLKPIVAIYSTFLQRAYDQLIHDVALQNLPVVFAVDRAGLVGSDGATHQGSYDLSFLRCIPNMTIMAPADENECRQMLYTGTTLSSPSAIRYPRGTGPGVPIAAEMTALPVGQAQVRREGRSGLAILAFGALVESAQKIAEHLDATIVNMRFVKPLDEKLVLSIASRHRAPSLPSKRTPSSAAPVPAWVNCSRLPDCSCRCCTSASPIASSNTERATPASRGRDSILRDSRPRSSNGGRCRGRSASVRRAAAEASALRLPRNRQYFHDLHGVAGENREMRVFLEQFCRRVVGVRLDDHIA